MKKDLPYILLQVLFCALLVALTAIFYMTPLRSLIENKFFDIKAQLSLNQLGQDDVLIINLHAPPLSTTATDTTYQETTHKEALESRLLNDAEKIFQALTESSARAYIFFASPQYIDPSHLTDEAWLIERADDPRMLVASFQAETTSPTLLNADFFGYADLIRKFRRAVVRDYYTQHPSLGPLIGQKLLDMQRHAHTPLKERPVPKHFLLNYISPHRLNALDASEFLTRKHAINHMVHNKIVIVGVNAYAPFTFTVRESTFANSPWQADGDQLENGLPNHYFHSIAAANIITRSWLERSRPVVHVLQTILFCIILLYSWRFSAVLATSTFIGCWFVTIVLHLIIAQMLYLHIPLADTAWFTSFALVGGAMLRLRKEASLSLAQEARLQERKHSDHTQDRFLDHFAKVLAQINEETKKILRNTPLASQGKGSLHDLFDKAMAASEELDDYLKGMRQFAGIQAASLSSLRPSITLQPSNIESLVTSVCRQFEARCKEKNVNLQIACIADSRPISINTDPTLLSQVLFNLISNAVKYSPVGGLVTVDMVQRHAKSISISVSDQGPGIETQFHEKIFEKFYRVKDDLVFKVKGHGLGLYLSAYFVRLLHGSITLKSAKDHGCQFTIHLGEDTGGQV